MKTAKRARRTKREVDSLREGICALLEQDNPMTLRQLFYRAVSAKLVAKTENEYKNTVGRLLLKMRLDGDIPFDWVADNTRWMRKPRTWSSLEEYCENAARSYRRSLWDDQDAYVEVWTEKDALAGVLLEETRGWDVPLMVSRGFSSVTYLYEAAESISNAGKPAYLYYFGDHDPSGSMIDPAIERRLREFAPDCEIYFQRVAVTEEQIVELHLPTRPTKTAGNSHAKKWRGGESVEVDAIEPARLRLIVRECIEQHIDREALARTRRVESLERETLRTYTMGMKRPREEDE